MDYLYGFIVLLVGCSLGLGLFWLMCRLGVLSGKNSDTDIIGGMSRSRNFLVWEIEAGPNETIQVLLDAQANVYLLDRANYSEYERGEPFQYNTGVWATITPVKMTAPHQGVWHVIVDLGGYAGHVAARVTVIRKEQLRAG